MANLWSNGRKIWTFPLPYEIMTTLKKLNVNHLMAQFEEPRRKSWNDILPKPGDRKGSLMVETLEPRRNSTDNVSARNKPVSPGDRKGSLMAEFAGERLRKKSWRDISLENIAKARKEFDFENVPQTVTRLRKTSMNVFTSMNSWLKRSTPEWKEEFVEEGALELLFEKLQVANSSSRMQFGDAILQLQIVGCIKTVLNSEAGLKYLIDQNRQLMQAFALSKCYV